MTQFLLTDSMPDADLIERIETYFVGPNNLLVALQSRLAERLEALDLADALLSGANMNRKVVERKVKAALAKAKGRPEPV